MNGQHRLNAVIKAMETDPNVSFDTIVVRNVTEDSFLTFDSGANRSLSDAFRLSDIKNWNVVSCIINKILQWRSSNRRTFNSEARSVACVTKKDCIDEYNKSPEYYQRIARQSSLWNSNVKILRTGDIGCLYVWLNIDRHHDEDVVYGFFNSLFTLTTSGTNAIMLLRQRLVRETMQNIKIPSAYKYALIAKAWNAYITGRDLKKLSWNEAVEGKVDFV